MTQGWEFTGIDPKLVRLDFVLVLIERPGRGARCVGAVGVEHPAVARAHEELGLGEPTHRATEVRAVDSEDPKFVAGKASYPAGYLCGLTVPLPPKRAYVFRQAGLVLRIVSQRADRYPVKPGI